MLPKGPHMRPLLFLALLTLAACDVPLIPLI